jgi:hypothetical protein
VKRRRTHKKYGAVDDEKKSIYPDYAPFLISVMRSLWSGLWFQLEVGGH